MSNRQNPGKRYVAVTPSDTAQVDARALYIGGDGDVSVRAHGASADVVFAGAKAGTVLPIEVARVNATSTTATNIVAIF